MRFLLVLLFVVAASANLAAATGHDGAWSTAGGRAGREDRRALKIIDSREMIPKEIWPMKEKVLTLKHKHIVECVNPLRKDAGEEPLPTNKRTKILIRDYHLDNHFIAINADEVVGFIKYWYPPRASYLQINDLVINPEHKDKCIAHMLMLAVAEDAAAKRGVGEVKVACFLSYDRPMEDFLASVGFEFPRGLYPMVPWQELSADYASLENSFLTKGASEIIY